MGKDPTSLPFKLDTSGHTFHMVSQKSLTKFQLSTVVICPLSIIFLSLSHFPTPLPVCPGITLQETTCTRILVSGSAFGGTQLREVSFPWGPPFAAPQSSLTYPTTSSLEPGLMHTGYREERDRGAEWAEFHQCAKLGPLSLAKVAHLCPGT